MKHKGVPEMRRTIHIDYSPEEMEKSRRRVEAFGSFRRADRVPVSFCIVPRFFAKQLGVRYADIFKDADTQFEYLLQFAKYQIENVRSDMLTSPVIRIHPYFDNVTAASHFGGHIEWPENETLHAVPHMGSIDGMIRFSIPEPEAGLFGTVIQWWRRMKERAEEYTVRFGDTEGRVEVPNLNLMALGPHMIAVDLVGTDFYVWCMEEPALCKEFLLKITRGIIEAEEYIRKLDPRPNACDAYGLAEDSSTIMSPAMFREFTMPYDRMLYERFGRKARGMHMCGPSLHLHEALVNDLRITGFDVFGYQVKPADIARSMGGRVRLWGNVNPMLMLSGSREEVREEALMTLEHLGPVGGFMLGDGANVCPGTPLENINALAEASEEYASAHPELFEPG